ncbi:hypothetical protein Daus18300_000188 [Diaporthe australafricana]|uniref:Calcineurin-like phosphoesterase domain-containing protein n=1 Tax=Diaporthe australafricana TaxID=127596 RepID=A0ABR3Y703_9PEZI
MHPSKKSTPIDPSASVITDLALSFGDETNDASTHAKNSVRWHRIEKELYLHTAGSTAWLHIAEASVNDLTTDDLVVTDIRVEDLVTSPGLESPWESRPSGIWVLRNNYTGECHDVVTSVDILFGVDAVDPRPQWTLLQRPLQLRAMPDVPVARLSLRHGIVQSGPSGPRPELQVNREGKFKISQISDTHMVTGVGVCRDAIDAQGHPLPPSEADPLTVGFIEGILDIEKPDLVVLTGDQVHHDIPDCQSALFKVVAPLVKRAIPWAAVFGNHDDEGAYALSRSEQMALLSSLPFSLCQPGPENVDGVGNYFLQVLSPSPSKAPVLTVFLLDSHGEIRSDVKDPDYDCIRPSQINWFVNTSQELKGAREKVQSQHDLHLALVFMHIPLPEYAESDLIIRSGHRGEPTEGPSFNSHFYDALVEEDVTAVGCGHDHVNDFCGLKEDRQERSSSTPQLGPWLCYGGSSGFGGYSSYYGKRYHRRTRVWEFDASNGSIKTWKRVEYSGVRTDEIVLAEGGAVVAPP